MAVQQFPGDFSLTEVNLYSHDGKKINIKTLVGEINLYESIISASLQCTIVIQDIGGNLISNLPIMGEERIEILIKSNSKRYTLNYYIYKIDGRVMKEKNQVYVLYGISLEAINNENFRLCEKIDNRKAEDYISEVLRRDNFTRKPFEFDESVYPYKMYIPNWRIYDTFVWLSRRTVPQYKKDSIGFLFYETFDGFKFKSIDKLIDAPQYPSPEVKYSFFQGNTSSTGASLRERFRVVSYSSPKAFDVYDDLRRGVFSHDCIYVDISNRTYQVFNTTADDFWKTSSHLENVKPYKTDANGVQLLNRGSRFIYRPSSISTWGWEESHTNLGKESIDPVNLNFEKSLYRNYFMQYNRMEISVPGDLENRCGNVINISIPSPEKTSDNRIIEDSRISGRYLVHSIRHSIVNRTQLKTLITLTRDSFGGADIQDSEISGRKINLTGINS